MLCKVSIWFDSIRSTSIDSIGIDCDWILCRFLMSNGLLLVLLGYRSHRRRSWLARCITTYWSGVSGHFSLLFRTGFPQPHFLAASHCLQLKIFCSLSGSCSDCSL
jgi:hypothetical protein